METLTVEGLGLGYHELRLDRATVGWVRAGSGLRDEVAELLAGEAEAVEQIGSSSVVGLLSKPIVDLAVGLSARQDVGAVISTPSADAFGQPNVTNPSPTVNHPRPRTRFAAKREPIITDRHPRPTLSALLGHTASAHQKRNGNVIAIS